MARFAPKRKWSVASSNSHPNQPSARCHSLGSAGNAHLKMRSFPSFSVFEKRGSQIFGQQKVFDIIIPMVNHAGLYFEFNILGHYS